MASYLPKFHDSQEINVFIEKQRDKVEIVKGLLIDKHFEKCIELCRTIIQDGKEAIESKLHHHDPYTPRSRTQPHAHSGSEDAERLNEIIDTAVILSIQAIAELNRWTEVISFVRKIYGEIEKSPPKVMQICLLLHAKVKEYIQCHALAKIWTHYESNHQLVGYKDVVSVYILQIVAPFKPASHSIKMLDNFKGLSCKDKLDLTHKLQECETSRTNPPKCSENKESARDDADGAHNDADESEDESDSSPFEENSNSPLDNMILYGGCKLRQWYCTLTKDKLYQIWKVIFMTALAIFAFVHTQYGDFTSNLNRAMVIWQGVLKVFKTMFGFDRS